jgi:hypothetical protein
MRECGGKGGSSPWTGLSHWSFRVHNSQRDEIPLSQEFKSESDEEIYREGREEEGEGINNCTVYLVY